jgi:succinate dehydrogenase / fumarate reductase cytochrome b subunit
MINPTKGQFHYILLKAHSLTGIIPIGLFLVFHLAINSLRTVGPMQYQISIDLINNLPFLIWIEILFIYIPLLFHSAMGFYITFVPDFNVLRYNHPRNWLYTLQRLTGGVVFVFLVYHVATTFGQKVYYGKDFFQAAPFLIDILNEEFGTWLGRIIYLIGILSATFHFTNGLWGFCVSWGIIIGPKAQRNASILFFLFGIGLTIIGFATVYEFSINPLSVEPTISGKL